MEGILREEKRSVLERTNETKDSTFIVMWRE